MPTIRQARPSTVSHAAVDLLQRLGVDTVFGIPGVHNQGLYDALVDVPGVRSVVTRHEQGAAFMADGFARASGRVGVCFVITGPGLTNAATALGEAYADSVPLLCVVTCYQSPPAGRSRRLHDLKDQPQLLAGLVKETFRVAGPGDLPSTLETALQEVVAGRPGPVAVEIPLEFLDVAFEPASVPSVAATASTAGDAVAVKSVAGGSEAGPHEPPGPTEHEPPGSTEALAMLEAGRRPVVVVGGGATMAAAQVVRFVDRLQAPVVSTAAGKGIVPDRHPLNIGAWLKATEVQNLIGQADPLILLGTEWSTTDLGEKPLPLPTNIVRIDTDTDPPPLGGITVRAEVGRTLVSWTPRLGQRGPVMDAPAVAQLRAAAAREPRRWPTVVSAYMEAMHAVLAEDAIIVNDMNTLSYAAAEGFPSNTPGTFLFPRGYGTLGYALPAAMGARLARPEQQVVAICGDGGFLFTSEELATAVRYGMNLPVVIWNNHSFGAIRATRTAAYGRSVDDDLINPDFVRLAEAYRCHGVRVTDPAGFRAELAAALTRSGPTLIEIDAPL